MQSSKKVKHKKECNGKEETSNINNTLIAIRSSYVLTKLNSCNEEYLLDFVWC